MMPTQKVANIASQLPAYYGKGTNKLDQVANVSMNTRFAIIFESMFIKKLLKFSNPQIPTLD